MGLFGMTESYIAFSALHFLQFVFALTVCGLYGIDLQRADSHDARADPRWVFAEVVAGMSAVTSAVYFIPFILRFAFLFVWDFILFILWIAVFGTFGKLFIKEDPEGDGDVRRMKNAVWVDLINALLWLVGGLVALAYWWRHRERRTRFTGRATVY